MTGAGAVRRRGLLAALVVVVSIGCYIPFAPVRLYDFRAFYCAGKAAGAHADPYREHPLHDCERASNAPGMPRSTADVTVPAPLPGYALAVFALLARIPFAPCALLWVLVSIAAVLGAARLLAIAIGVSPAVTLVVVGIPAAIVAIPLGQVTPLVCLGIAVCAYALRAQRSGLAVAGALLTAFDPPVALALCAALFVAFPATRVRLIAGAAALAAISIALLGLPANVEYLSTVLHAHAYANVVDRTQFSATHFAWAAGLGRSGAVTLGSAWYAVSAAAGIALALRLRRRLGDIAPALVPPAFAVFGGLYVHYAQLALAFPACLLVAVRAADGAREKDALYAGVFVLAIPWLTLSAFPVFAFATVVLAAVYCRGLDRAAIAARLGMGCALALLGSFAVAARTFTPAAAVVPVAVAGNPLAEVSWQAYLGARDARPDLLVFVLQLPTLVAFAGCVWALARTAVARRVKNAG